MVQGVWSENLEQQIDATTQFRKLLSIGVNAVSPITDLLPLQHTRLILNAIGACLQRETHQLRRSSAKESSRALCSSCSARMRLSSR